MKKLGSKGRAWLKGLHVFFCCGWLGTALSMMLLMLVRSTLPNGDELSAVIAAIKLLDDFIIIPTALGSLITGLLICWLTNWGFTRFNWVIVKWVSTIALVLFGTFWLGPWLNGAAAIADAERAMALKNSTYLHFRQMNLVFGSAQALILVALVFLTALKPWGNRGKPDK
jgi:uncharacterized membrane protein